VGIVAGRDWGEPAALPAGAPVVASDRQLSELAEAARRQRGTVGPVGLVGGDLCRTLGGGREAPATAEARLRGGGGVRYPIDVGEVLADGVLGLFVAHLVARTARWRHAFVAMNAQYLTARSGRAWDLAPRAHPNDGLLDTLEADLELAQALAVRARLPLGTHLPHPGVTSRRTAAVQVSWARARPLRLDGARVGTARTLSVRVRPDALAIWV